MWSWTLNFRSATTCNERIAIKWRRGRNYCKTTEFCTWLTFCQFRKQDMFLWKSVLTEGFSNTLWWWPDFWFRKFWARNNSTSQNAKVCNFTRVKRSLSMVNFEQGTASKPGPTAGYLFSSCECGMWHGAHGMVWSNYFAKATTSPPTFNRTLAVWHAGHPFLSVLPKKFSSLHLRGTVCKVKVKCSQNGSQCLHFGRGPRTFLLWLTTTFARLTK